MHCPFMTKYIYGVCVAVDILVQLALGDNFFVFVSLCLCVCVCLCLYLCVCLCVFVCMHIWGDKDE